MVVKGDRTGFVRYIGHLDNVGKPSAIFIGLELDAPGRELSMHSAVFRIYMSLWCVHTNGDRYRQRDRQNGLVQYEHLHIVLYKPFFRSQYLLVRTPP